MVNPRKYSQVELAVLIGGMSLLVFGIIAVVVTIGMMGRGSQPVAQSSPNSTTTTSTVPASLSPPPSLTPAAPASPTSSQVKTNVIPSLDAAATAIAPDPSNWRNDYFAFIANFRVTKLSDEEWDVDWGELVDLKLIHDASAPFGRNRRDISVSEVKAAKERMGRIVWQAKLLAPVRGEGMGIKFDLPNPPAPVTIAFFPKTASEWAEVQPGDTVRFECNFSLFGLNSPSASVKLLGKVP